MITFTEWIRNKFEMSPEELANYVSSFYPEEARNVIECDVFSRFRAVYMNNKEYFTLFELYVEMVVNGGKPVYPTRKEIENMIDGAKAGNQELTKQLLDNYSIWKIDGFIDFETAMKIHKLS